MNLAQYSKGLGAALGSLLVVLNQLLPLTSGNTKLEVNAALAVLTVLLVVFFPANAPATPEVKNLKA